MNKELQQVKYRVILDLAEALIKNIKDLNGDGDVNPAPQVDDHAPIFSSCISDYPEYEKKLASTNQTSPPSVYRGDKDIGDMDIVMAGKMPRPSTPTPPPSLKGDEAVPSAFLESVIVGHESDKPGVFAVPDIPESALVDNYLCCGTRKAIENAITGGSAPKAFAKN